MTEEEKKSIQIVSDEGSEMMRLESFGREGDRMTVQGALMGAWLTKMYVSPQDSWKMIGMILKPQIIGYILSLPFILLRSSKDKQS